ncbi:hypothetical protein Vi05172_g1043 [Venturia inaequalis]|nr:hypothetical protein Vi05172_g1043 [Venturia inaequalis]
MKSTTTSNLLTSNVINRERTRPQAHATHVRSKNTRENLESLAKGTSTAIMQRFSNYALRLMIPANSKTWWKGHASAE